MIDFLTGLLVVIGHRAASPVRLHRHAHLPYTPLGQSRSDRVYIVKATDHRGPVSYACGTVYQALERASDLAGRGVKDVIIKDPKGKEWDPQALEASLG